MSERTPTGDTVDTTLLRRAFGTFATGVTVVTVGGDRPHGMTANSFTSVSLTPALVLVCIDRGAAMHELVLSAPGFGISVLAGHQEPVARHFANRSRPLGAAQFHTVDWVAGEHTGAPLIEHAIARFECRRWGTYEAGDHTVVVGELLSLETSTEGEPLLFHRGKFLHPTTPVPVPQVPVIGRTELSA